MFLSTPFISVVYGAKTENLRPIEDWIYGNDHDNWDPSNTYPWFDHTLTQVGNPFGNWRGYIDPESLLGIHFDWVALNDEIEYKGFVLERPMPDGSLKIKVHLEVKGIYVEVYNIKPEGPLHWSGFQDLAFVGYMDYLFDYEFVIYQEPRAQLPTILEIYLGWVNGYEVQWKSMGIATGHRVQPDWLPPELSGRIPYWWFLPPEQVPVNPPILTEEAKVVVNQILINHPVNILEFWPIEMIKII